MYLLRLPNSVYDTRIAPHLPLRESGYPKEFTFSFLTRDAINQLCQNYRSQSETTTNAPMLSGITAVKTASPRSSVGKEELNQLTKVAAYRYLKYP
ncbi:hypothetical protein P4S52_17570 [Vibrio sp. SA48]